MPGLGDAAETMTTEGAGISPGAPDFINEAFVHEGDDGPRD
jgi:hypothetical protein